MVYNNYWSNNYSPQDYWLMMVNSYKPTITNKTIGWLVNIDQDNGAIQTDDCSTPWGGHDPGLGLHPQTLAALSHASGTAGDSWRSQGMTAVMSIFSH